MYEDESVSIVIPAYNEEDAIEEVVTDFNRDYVDEIVVVDNNSTDNTAELAEKAGARVVKESNQGYGHAIMRGLREAEGDLVFITESDATFVAEDMEKFLAYKDDADMVLGTRVTEELLDSEAKMDWFLHWGNLFLAKLIQLRFWGRTRLTDVGCTYRMINRDALDKVMDQLHVGGSHFSPHMIIVCLKNGVRTVEIPVKYNKRKGQSKITSDRTKSFKLGLQMMKLILLDRP